MKIYFKIFSFLRYYFEIFSFVNYHFEMFSFMKYNYEALCWLRGGQVEEARSVEPDREPGSLQPPGLLHRVQTDREDGQELPPSRPGVGVLASDLITLTIRHSQRLRVLD